MCPGGEVVCSATEPGRTAVNGMSYHARDAKNSNSAIVAAVGTGDMEGGPGGALPCSGGWRKRPVKWQADMAPPVQRFSDFAAGPGQPGLKGSESSYRPYVVPGDLNACLPGTLAQESGRIGDFDPKNSPVLQKRVTGRETRTSSPVRILRRPMERPGSAGPVSGWEGSAGYAGGIVSAQWMASGRRKR